MRAFAAEGVLAGAGCCAPASNRASMAIATSTIKQMLANRHMVSSRVTLTWASRINKLTPEAPSVLQHHSRHTRPALSRKRQHVQIVHACTKAGATLNSGLN